jgi:hypothetical protein
MRRKLILFAENALALKYIHIKLRFTVRTADARASMSRATAQPVTDPVMESERFGIKSSPHLR